jgi:replicative DNA helicase
VNRVPPHNTEAEQIIIGSILIDNSSFSNVAEITPEDFYNPLHQEIYNAILRLNSTNKPIDIITISEELKEHKNIIETLTLMIDKTYTSQNIKYYAEIIEQKSRLRKQLKSIQLAATKLYEKENPDEVTEILEKGIEGSNKKTLSNLIHIKDAIGDYLSQLEERANNKGGIPGVPTGFTELDIKLGGLQKGNVYLVAARPSMGKTAFVTNIASYISIKKKLPVAFFSLEMPKEQLLNRIVSEYALIDSNKLKLGRLTDEDWLKVVQTTAIINESMLFVDDTPALKLPEIKAKSRRIKNQQGELAAIIIDYLQIVTPTSRQGNREQEISEISRGLKILAKELGCPVIALSQLSRACEQRADKRPMLSDLRESGAIEQDADVVMFLYRDDYYNPDSDRKNIAEVSIAKGRNEGTGTIELAWIGQYTKFANLERWRGHEEVDPKRAYY